MRTLRLRISGGKAESGTQSLAAPDSFHYPTPASPPSHIFCMKIKAPVWKRQKQLCNLNLESMNKLVVTHQLQDSPSLGSRASHQSFLKSALHCDFENENKRFCKEWTQFQEDAKKKKNCVSQQNYISIDSLPPALKWIYINLIWTLKKTAARDRMPAVEVKEEVIGPSVKFLSSRDQKNPEAPDICTGWNNTTCFQGYQISTIHSNMIFSYHLSSIYLIQGAFSECGQIKMQNHQMKVCWETEYSEGLSLPKTTYSSQRKDVPI